MAQINKHTAKVLAELRGITVADLAAEIGMNRTVLSESLNAGTRRIPIDKLLPLANALSVDPRAILGPDDADASLTDAAA